MALSDFDWLGGTTDKVKKNLQAKAGSEVELTISKWLKERIEVAQSMLEEDDRNGSSALSNSIRPKNGINFKDEKILVEIVAESYWDYINKGVNGVFNNFGSKYSFKTLGVGTNMRDAFKKFIELRNITPRDPEMSYDNLAYLLARATKSKGIKSTPFMDDAFSVEAINDLGVRLGKTVKRIFE